MLEATKLFFKRYWATFLGLILGAIGGYLYWMFIGCATGSCPITSSPLNSTIFGTIFGGLIFNTFSKQRKQK